MTAWLTLALFACGSRGADDTAPPPPEVVDPGPVEVPDLPEENTELPLCAWVTTDAVAQALFAIGGAAETPSCPLGGVQAKAHEVRLRFSRDDTFMRVALRPAACHPDEPALASGWVVRTAGSWDGCNDVLQAVKASLDEAQLPEPTALDLQPHPPPEVPPARPELPRGGVPMTSPPPAGAQPLR